MEFWADVVPRREGFHQGGLEFALGRRSFNGNERNCLFRNAGGFRFDDIGYVAGVDGPEDGRGAVAADLNGDGAPDLVVNNHRQPTRIWTHRGAPGRGWCTIRLRGASPKNADALGATVTCRAEGLPTQALPINAGTGYLSQSPAAATFGLADRTAATIEVRWPGGRVTTHAPVGPGVWEIEERSGDVKPVR